MKKSNFMFLGMLTMVLTLGLVVVGCATTPFDPTESQKALDGSWTHQNPDSLNATFVFSGDSFIYKTDGGQNVQGTYTISKSLGSLKLTLNGTDGSTWSATYTVKDDTLSIPNEPQRKNWEGAYWWGDFKKQ